MRDLNLQPLPNQEFTVELEGHRVDIAIRTSREVMVADVSLDELVLVSGVRLVAGEPMLPYKYLSTWGNLVLLTQNDELPWWESFGSSQSLVFVSPDEIDALP